MEKPIEVQLQVREIILALQTWDMMVHSKSLIKFNYTYIVTDKPDCTGSRRAIDQPIHRTTNGQEQMLRQVHSHTADFLRDQFK